MEKEWLKEEFAKAQQEVAAMPKAVREPHYVKASPKGGEDPSVKPSEAQVEPPISRGGDV